MVDREELEEEVCVDGQHRFSPKPPPSAPPAEGMAKSVGFSFRSSFFCL